MSDPVTNVEIEDVLSSIRRLVSDGDKARTRDPAPVAEPENTPDAAAEPADVASSEGAEVSPEGAEVSPEGAEESPEPTVKSDEGRPERFVLTPSLMVVDTQDAPRSDDTPDEPARHARWFEPDDPATEVAWSDDASEDEPDEDAGWPQDAEDEAKAAEIAEEPDLTAGQDDPDTSSDDRQDPDAPLALTDMVSEPSKESVAADSDNHKSDQPKSSEKPKFDVPDRSRLVATIAELEAAVSGDSGEFEPDGSETMGQTIAWPGAAARDLQDAEDAETVDEPDATAAPDIEDTTATTEQADDPDGADLAGSTPASEPVDAPDPTDVADDTAAEPAVDDAVADEPVDDGPADDEPADDENGDDEQIAKTAFAHRPVDFAAASHAEDAPVPDGGYEDDDLDSLLDAGGVTLDEEALRQLVSDVVREELTGPLGERITRNVRKLVRREIYRILSSQEFD